MRAAPAVWLRWNERVPCRADEVALVFACFLDIFSFQVRLIENRYALLRDRWIACRARGE